MGAHSSFAPPSPPHIGEECAPDPSSLSARVPYAAPEGTEVSAPV